MKRARPAAASSACSDAMRALAAAQARVAEQTAVLAELTASARRAVEEQAVILQELNANVQRAMEALESVVRQEIGAEGASSPPLSTAARASAALPAARRGSAVSAGAGAGSASSSSAAPFAYLSSEQRKYLWHEDEEDEGVHVEPPQPVRGLQRLQQLDLQQRVQQQQQQLQQQRLARQRLQLEEDEEEEEEEEAQVASHVGARPPSSRVQRPSARVGAAGAASGAARPGVPIPRPLSLRRPTSSAAGAGSRGYRAPWNSDDLDLLE
jgi:hypothetical protein